MMKLIKIILALALIHSTYALNTPRIGLSFGPGFHEAKPKNQEGGLTISNIHKNTPHITAFVGYDHAIQDTPLFIGIEGELSSHSFEKTSYFCLNGFTGGEITLRTNMSKNAAMRLGIKANDVLLYGKVGMAHTNWNTKVKTINETYQKGQEKFGSIVGGGIECDVNSNVSIGMEHSFVSYRSIDNIHPRTSFSYLPSAYMTKIRLSYNF